MGTVMSLGDMLKKNENKVPVGKGNATALRSLASTFQRSKKTEEESEKKLFASIDDISMNWESPEGAKRVDIMSIKLSNSGRWVKMLHQYEETAADGTARLKHCIRQYQKKSGGWGIRTTMNLTHNELMELGKIIAVLLMAHPEATEQDIAERYAAYISFMPGE